MSVDATAQGVGGSSSAEATPSSAEAAAASAASEIVLPWIDPETGNLRTGVYTSQGLHYKKKQAHELGKPRSYEEIYQYLAKVQPQLAKQFGVQGMDAFPYTSIMDFVCTLRQSSSTKQSVFQWPNESFSYNRLVNIALHYLPPGCGFTIENKAPLPDWAWSEYLSLIHI